jgi:hypothetical protein
VSAATSVATVPRSRRPDLTFKTSAWLESLMCMTPQRRCGARVRV